MTMDKRPAPRDTEETASPKGHGFHVKATMRNLGATEDIRAYVFRTLIDIMPDRLYAKDTQNRFILANFAAAHFMGKKRPAELVGKTDSDFYPPELAMEFTAVEQKVFQTGQPLIAIEQLSPNPYTGEPEWTQTTKVPLRDVEGEVIGLVGIARDITQHKRFESEITRQNAELVETNAKLSRAHEQLLQSEKLISVGLRVSAIAREMADPLMSALARLEAIEARLARAGAMLNALAGSRCDDGVSITQEAAVQLECIRKEIDLGALMAETRDGLERVSTRVGEVADLSQDEKPDLGDRQENASSILRDPHG